MYSPLSQWLTSIPSPRLLSHSLSSFCKLWTPEAAFPKRSLCDLRITEANSNVNSVKKPHKTKGTQCCSICSNETSPASRTGFKYRRSMGVFESAPRKREFVICPNLEPAPAATDSSFCTPRMVPVVHFDRCWNGNVCGLLQMKCVISQSSTMSPLQMPQFQVKCPREGPSPILSTDTGTSMIGNPLPKDAGPPISPNTEPNSNVTEARESQNARHPRERTLSLHGSAIIPFSFPFRNTPSQASGAPETINDAAAPT
jgi:hypothetical protein